MYADINVLHRPRPHALEWVANDRTGAPIHVWRTCLRTLVFGPADAIDSLPRLPGDVVYRGLEAYGFCLEVACGLRSPLIGETEVFGQFKNACQSFAPLDDPWGSQFRRFTTGVFADAKKVRQAHLSGLGSQSYGSVVRRELKGCQDVHVIGAGHLVEEMLPWLAKDGVAVHVHARDPEKARCALAPIAPQVHVSALADGCGLGGADALIVAAPLAAREIEALSLRAPNLRLLIDLRADSRTDLVTAPARRLTLPDVLLSVDSNLIKLQAHKRAALGHVAEIVAACARSIEYRPFGWDDLCA